MRRFWHYCSCKLHTPAILTSRPLLIELRPTTGHTRPDYDKLIREFLQTRLKDPGSAQLRYEGEPKKDVILRGATNAGTQYGYRVRVQINAKNAYGGYTGEHLYVFDFRDGAIANPETWDLTERIRRAKAEGDPYAE